MPAADPLILAIDLGTSSVRTASSMKCGTRSPGPAPAASIGSRHTLDHGAELDPAGLLRATQKCLRQTRRLTKETGQRSAAPVSGTACSDLIGPENRSPRSIPGPTRAAPRMRRVCARSSTNARSNSAPAACSGRHSGRRNCFGFAALGRNFFAVSRAGSLPRNGFSRRFSESGPAATRWPAGPGCTIWRAAIGTTNSLNVCRLTRTQLECFAMMCRPRASDFPGDRRRRGQQPRLGRRDAGFVAINVRNERRGPRHPPVGSVPLPLVFPVCRRQTSELSSAAR